jgi:SPP1 gp7 family putative phage head morphogenesis protein
MDRVVDPWIDDVAAAFEDVLDRWAATESTALDFDVFTPAIDAAEDALFWTLIYSHARGVVDVRERLGVPVGSFADFMPVDAVRAAVDAAGYSFDVWRGLAVQFGEFASVIATKIGHEAYSRIQLSLGDAIGRGETKAQWVQANGINNIGVLRNNPWYINNVFRTNTSTYYAAGKWNSFTAIPEVRELVEYLEFIAILDDRTTPVCEGMDGTIKLVDDPIWSRMYPPNHYMCRSTVEPISKYENAKPKDPAHLHDPGKGFDTNVGTSYAEIPHRYEAELISAGLGPQVSARQEDMKNRIISSTLWVDKV